MENQNTNAPQDSATLNGNTLSAKTLAELIKKVHQKGFGGFPSRLVRKKDFRNFLWLIHHGIINPNYSGQFLLLTPAAKFWLNFSIYRGCQFNPSDFNNVIPFSDVVHTLRQLGIPDDVDFPADL